MIERPATARPNKLQDPLDMDQYLEDLGTARTARHASEEFHSPKPEAVGQAVRSIRQDIGEVFTAVPATSETQLGHSLEDAKARYWERAARVGVEAGAKPGFELEDYLKVGEGRSYEKIKEQIESEYTADSLPRAVLDGVDAYSQVLEINPAHATTITMELIGRHLSDIKQAAARLEAEGLPAHEATRQAFSQFITSEVPFHINDIMTKYGRGDEAIRPAMNKSSFYPTPETTLEGKASLKLSQEDAAGLIEVYDIQSRPYDDETLALGDEIAHIPQMQMTMLRVQEELVDVSREYLAAHPERAAGNLENFSEIFVPERHEDGMVLLPNPKLLRAMVNNVMPAIALNLQRRGVGIESMTEEDIQEGVKIAAKEFKLFQSKIGQFDNFDPSDQTVELESTYQVVCPANSMFPNFLTAKLARYYNEEVEAVAR